MDKGRLIESLVNQNFQDEIIEAFEEVNREDHIPKKHKFDAYLDTALPIGYGATISQPYTIAFMLNLLELKESQKILEVGSGSGYVLALLNKITQGKIYGIEIIRELVDSSRTLLKNHENISILNKNGKKGLSEKAPFDRILISASSHEVPTNLINQLKPNGILVAPIKNSIVKITKLPSGKLEKKKFPGFLFIPLQD